MERLDNLKCNVQRLRGLLEIVMLRCIDMLVLLQRPLPIGLRVDGLLHPTPHR